MFKNQYSGMKTIFMTSLHPHVSKDNLGICVFFSYYGGKVFILFEDSGKTQMVIPEGSPFQPCINSHEIAIIWNVNFLCGLPLIYKTLPPLIFRTDHARSEEKPPK